MSVFNMYARYYDLLYRDKNYEAEADYVHGLIGRFSHGASSILELGSGTGRHAQFLAQYGYTLHGVEMSELMLMQARELARNSDRLIFDQGDIRTVKLAREFDVVQSLFHVISYQRTNEDVIATLRTARTHIKKGGLLLFDCWYGPAVLTDKPSVRVKRMNDDNMEVVRIAEPVLRPNENIVDVHYEILVRNLDSTATEKLQEVHSMRYFFVPELKSYLADSGFRLVHSEEWMTGASLGFNTWGALFAAERIE